MTANFINRAFGRASLRGVDRVRHAALAAATGSKQYAAGIWPLDLGGYVGGARTRGTRLAIGLRAGSPPQRESWVGVIRGWQLTKAADFDDCLSTLRVLALHASCRLPDLSPVKRISNIDHCRITSPCYIEGRVSVVESARETRSA